MFLFVNVKCPYHAKAHKTQVYSLSSWLKLFLTLHYNTFNFLIKTISKMFFFSYKINSQWNSPLPMGVWLDCLKLKYSSDNFFLSLIYLSRLSKFCKLEVSLHECASVCVGFSKVFHSTNSGLLINFLSSLSVTQQGVCFTKLTCRVLWNLVERLNVFGNWTIDLILAATQISHIHH